MFKLLHVTTEANIDAIMKDGLRSGTYFAGDDELADYYRETVVDEGESPVTLEVSIDDLREEFLRPDLPGIEEPISTVIGLSEEEVRRVWRKSGKSRRDSLSIIRSVRYDAPVPPQAITIVDAHIEIPAPPSIL